MSEIIALTRPFDVGSLAAGNYTQTNVDGFMRAYGLAITHKDEYPSSPWVAAGNRAAPDLTDHTIGGVARRMWSFDGVNTEEALSSSFEIPHEYAYYNPLWPLEANWNVESHLHVRPSTTGSGVARFVFNWEHSPSNADPIAQPDLVALVTIEAGTQYRHLLEAFGFLGLQNLHLGDKIGFNISRDPTHVDDTYAGDVLLEQVALHVPCDTRGSHDIYDKYGV